MATEKRLIDANALKEKATLRHGFDFQGIFVRVQDIDKAPTVDAVEVVRCKDCAWSMRDDDSYYCINPDGLDNYAKPDDFCPYGERRKNHGEKKETL